MMHTCMSSLWLEEDFLCILLPSVELILCSTGAHMRWNSCCFLPSLEFSVSHSSRTEAPDIFKVLWFCDFFSTAPLSPKLARNIGATKQDLEPGDLTSQSVHEQLCSFRKSRSCWGSWSGPPRTSQQAFLCPRGCCRFQHFPHRTYGVFTAGWSSVSTVTFSYFKKELLAPCSYSRGIALCVRQVFHQNIQTIVLIVQELLGPSTIL